MRRRASCLIHLGFNKLVEIYELVTERCSVADIASQISKKASISSRPASESDYPLSSHAFTLPRTNALNHAPLGALK